MHLKANASGPHLCHPGYSSSRAASADLRSSFPNLFLQVLTPLEPTMPDPGLVVVVQGHGDALPAKTLPRAREGNCAAEAQTRCSQSREPEAWGTRGPGSVHPWFWGAEVPGCCPHRRGEHLLR